MKTWMTLLVLSLALLAGCSSSSDPSGDEGSDYPVPSDPDILVDNFCLAWESLDIEGYSAMIYDGEEPLPGKEDCEAFKFYFMAGSYEDPFWGYVDECTHTEALFSGEMGANEIPGVESIDLSLNPFSDWSDFSGAVVEDDLAPEGCKAKTYYTDATFQLKDTIPGGGNINAFLISDMIRFYVIPVDGDGTTEYRLWKWLAVASYKGAQESGWSVVKPLY